jgi:hypothetical protein
LSVARDGGVVSIDTASGNSRPEFDTPAALDAELSLDRRTMWLTAGVRAIFSSSFRPARERGIVSIRAGSPTREQRRYALDGAEPPRRYQLPLSVREVVAEGTKLWLVGEHQLLSVPLPVGLHLARVWRPPNEQAILAVDSDASLVVTTRPGSHATLAR